MTEWFTEAGSVPGDRDVAARGPGQCGPRVVAGARAQGVPADPFHDDDVDVELRDDESRQRRAFDRVQEQLLFGRRSELLVEPVLDLVRPYVGDERVRQQPDTAQCKRDHEEPQSETTRLPAPARVQQETEGRE